MQDATHTQEDGWTGLFSNVSHRKENFDFFVCDSDFHSDERWGAGVETQKNVRGEIEGWGRVPFNETYAPLLSTIYDGW